MNIKSSDLSLFLIEKENLKNKIQSEEENISKYFEENTKIQKKFYFICFLYNENEKDKSFKKYQNLEFFIKNENNLELILKIFEHSYFLKFHYYYKKFHNNSFFELCFPGKSYYKKESEEKTNFFTKLIQENKDCNSSIINLIFLNKFLLIVASNDKFIQYEQLKERYEKINKEMINIKIINELKIKENKKLEEDLKNKNKENDELKSKITELEKLINNYTNKKEQKAYEEAYDIVLEGSSFLKPWIIKKNKNLNFENLKQKQPIITIIGNFDKGKTFILSELAKKEFPSGFDKQTPWICMYYPRNEKESQFLNAIMIDSAGFETPLEFKTNDANYDPLVL